MIKTIPALLMTMLLAAGTSSAQENRGPRIVVDEIRYDLGTVAQGTQASHVFEIMNDGTETLIIERVQAD
jgi:hypothetical protein